MYPVPLSYLDTPIIANASACVNTPPTKHEKTSQTKQKQQVVEYNLLAFLASCGVYYRLSGAKSMVYRCYISLSPSLNLQKVKKQHKTYTMSTTIDFCLCLWCVVGGGGEGVGRVGKCITPLSIAEFFNSSKLLQPEKIFTEFFDFE